MIVRTLVGGAMALAATIPGCAPEPARPAQTIHIGEHYDAPFNAVSGDTIIITMDPTAGWQLRCEDMGGEPITNPFTDLNECDGVDF